MTTEPLLSRDAPRQADLALLCAVAFLDFVDASIVNVALPSIRHACTSPCRACSGCPAATCSPTAGSCCSAAAPPTCSAAGACSSPGTVMFGVSSLDRRARRERRACWSAPAWRRALGAAMMLPAALSILTTTFRGGHGPQHGARASGAASAGSRPPPACCSAACSPRARAGAGCCSSTRSPACSCSVAIFRLIAGERRRAPLAELRRARAPSWPPAGCCCSSTRWCEAPIVGWGTRADDRRARRGASSCSSRSSSTSGASATRSLPLVDLPHQRARVRRRHAADRVRRLPRDVLLPHAVHAERARLLADPDRRWPTCRCASRSAICAGIASQLLARVGTRPVIVGGALIAAGGRLLAVAHPGRTAPTSRDLLPGHARHLGRPRRRCSSA